MRSRTLALVVSLIAGLTNTFAQNSVKGSVYDATTKKPLEGVSIVIQGTDASASTDIDGNFTLNSPVTGKQNIDFVNNRRTINKEVEIKNGITDIGTILLSQSIYDLSLDELVKLQIKVSSTKSKNIFNTPSTVTVIDHDFIQRYNFLTIAEAIRTVSGIDIASSNLDVNIPVSRGILQSFYANKILILINNIPVWQPLFGNASLDRIDINDVKRIEVLKGPASVLYGTNAYTGVINIILQDKSTEGVQAKALYGYPSLSGASVSLVTKHNDFSLYVSANTYFEKRKPYYRESDSVSATTPYQKYNYTEEEKKANINIIASYKGHSIFINPFTHEYTYPGSGLSISGGGGQPFTETGILSGYRFEKNITDNIQITSQFSHDYSTRNILMNATASQAVYTISRRISGVIKSIFSFWDKTLNIEVGIDGEEGRSLEGSVIDVYTNKTVQTTMEKGEKTMNLSTFTQVEYQLGKLTLLGGTRFVNNDVYGKHISSRGTSVFQINNTNSIKLIWGQAFRAPSLLELYFNHPTVVGNKDLKPETCTSTEISYLSGLGNFFVQLNGYYASYNDLIQRVVYPSGPASYRNVTSFDTYGLESELKYQSSSLSAFLNYNLMKGNGNDAKSNFDLIPQHTISSGLSIPIKSFSIAANGYYCTKVQGVLREIPAQYFIDLNSTYSHKVNNIHLTHSISAKNITQSDMLTPQYYRPSKKINELPTMAFGTRIFYSLRIEF